MATRETSRALTIHAALARYDLLKEWVSGTTCLTIHLLGADLREGCCYAETAACFAPLCALLVGTRWSMVNLVLCGPNCISREPPSEGRPVAQGPILRVAYTSLMYEEWRQSDSSAPRPHMAFAFQAGLWGYDSWRPSIERVVRETTLVITCYNRFEADDDEDVLASWGTPVWEWSPESNPMCSPTREVRA